MMYPSGTPRSLDATLEQLWRQVCASRGTPAPDPALLAGFIQGVGTPERQKLESVLTLAARGREPPGDLGLLSWATACTRPSLLIQLKSHGLAFTSADLFACGIKLREEGWDMQHRIAQLASHPGDVDTLRGLLPALLPVRPGEPEAALQELAAPGNQAPENEDDDEAFNPWLDDGLLDGIAPDWPGEHASPVNSGPSAALPQLPTRFERQPPASSEARATKAERAMDESRLRLRLFGKAAAHTLEITQHRRGGDFMGVHVVSIDSALALPSGGGYAWERKLVLQLTPEEMPAVVATLMGLTPSVRFGHHGAERAKFIEVRRQAGGLVLVTGERALSYSVPVPAGTVYYVLELFCRAMAMGRQADMPGRSVSDVLLLVRSAHGF